MRSQREKPESYRLIVSQLRATHLLEGQLVTRSSEVIMRSSYADKGLPQGLPQRPAAEQPASEKAFSQNEKFDLLSAYLDGEVSEQEERLVTQWLASDTQLQQHYHAQLKLRQSIQQLAAELFPSNSSPDQASTV